MKKAVLLVTDVSRSVELDRDWVLEKVIGIH